MTEETCPSRFPRIDDVLTCKLAVGHIEPTEAQPQGSPHESTEIEQPSGDPVRWWG